MKLLVGLLIVAAAQAQPPNPFVNGTIADANAMNAFLQTKASKFNGAGPPATVTNSTLGDVYVNTINRHIYVCYQLPGPCTTVATGNWVDSTGGLIPVTASVLKGDNAGNATPVTGAASNCVHVDGNSASCPGGGSTIPVTTSALRGDGAGNATAVTGAGTNCVLVNGGSGTCGTGGSTTLTDCYVSFGSSASLTVFGNASVTTVCAFQRGTTITLITTPATITTSGGTALLYVSVGAAGAISVGAGAASGTVGCSGCTVTSATAFPVDSKPIWTWQLTSGVFSATGTDYRSPMSYKPSPSSGRGVSITPGDQDSIATDATVIPAKFSGATTPGSIASSTLGDLYVNTVTADVYVCNNGSGACTSVAAGNWVKINGTGGGGSGCVPGGTAGGVLVTDGAGACNPTNIQINSNTISDATSTQLLTLQGGADASANSALGGALLRGADQTGAGGSSSSGGDVLLRAGTNAGTNSASRAGSLELSAGQSSAGGVNGELIFDNRYVTGGGTTTQWFLQCLVSSRTVNNCGATPENWLGVADATSASVTQVHIPPSQSPISASAAVTVGHTVCAGSTAGKVTDSGGTTTCTNAQGSQVGVVIATAGNFVLGDGTSVALSTTLPLIQMNTALRAPAGGGGGSLYSDYQKVTTPITMDGTDKTLYTSTMPGASLASGHCLELNFQTQHTSGSTPFTLKVWFGITSYTVYTGSADPSVWRSHMFWCNDPGATNSQQISMEPFFFSTNSNVVMVGGDLQTTAIDTTSSVIVKVTANGTGPDTMTGISWLIHVI